MTKRECAIVEAYTGIVMCAGDNRKYFYEYVDEIMARPCYTHEHLLLHEEIKEKAKPDFIKLCRESIDGQESTEGQVMFIELTNVYYNPRISRYTTGKLFIRTSDIVTVIDENDFIDSYGCRRVQLSNGEVYYVMESCKHIMSLIYKKEEEEDNDWK